MSPPCAPKRIFLIRLKITPFRFERVKHFVECWTDDFRLCTSHFAADYIVTELKSPSRIVRNAKQRNDKSNKREKKGHGKKPSIKEEHSYIKKEAIITTTKRKGTYVKQEAEDTHTSPKSETPDIVKQEPIDQDYTLHPSLNKSCSSSSLDFEQQPSSLPEVTT
ncbi:hypothetical protein MBANPS3_011436 [Mucor bainieri]